MNAPLVVSRCDRLGDLVLSLPAVAFLKSSGVFSKVALHCSSYAKDLGEWARFNGVCDEVLCLGTEALVKPYIGATGLALFHASEARDFFRALKIQHSMGPRSKISALWSYKKSLAQHRSRVEKSEMEYNLDLAQAFLKWHAGVERPFVGLSALKVPSEWRCSVDSPDWCFVALNRGSAENLSLSELQALALDPLQQGLRVDILVSGENEAAIREELLRGPLARFANFRVQGSFPSIRELIAYLAPLKKLVASSTGPLHLAHAAGVPVLGYYPRARVRSFKRWRPHGFWHSSPVEFKILQGSSGVEKL